MVSKVEVQNVSAEPGEDGLAMIGSGSSVVRLVSEVPTENRSKNTESDRSG